MEYLTNNRMVDWSLPTTVAYLKVLAKSTYSPYSELQHEANQGSLYKPGSVPEVLHGKWSVVEIPTTWLKEYPYTKELKIYRSHLFSSGFIYTAKYQVFMPCANDGVVKIKKKTILNAWHPALENYDEIEDMVVFRSDYDSKYDSTSESEYSSDSESVLLRFDSEDSVQDISDLEGPEQSASESNDEEEQNVLRELRLITPPDEDAMFINGHSEHETRREALKLSKE